MEATHEEARLNALVQESPGVVLTPMALKLAGLTMVNVDTAEQENAMMFPTDAKLLRRSRVQLVRFAKDCGIPLHQSNAPAVT